MCALSVNCMNVFLAKICFFHRVWISSDDVVDVAQKGFRFVHAASNYFYLVCIQPLFSFVSTYSDMHISTGLRRW